MAIKISETLSLAGGNLARPTRFSALIAPPPEVLGAADSKTFDVLCKNVKIPDITMEPIDISYKGHIVKIPSRVKQEQTIELTMYLDEDHTLRQLFSDWISAIDDRFYAISTTSSANLYRSHNIFGNLIIKTRDFEESPDEPMNYLIEGIYPITVSGPEYGSAAVGEISEFTVTLAYYRFLSQNIDNAYDNIDEGLDAVGVSAEVSGTSLLGAIDNTIGFVNDTLSTGAATIGAVNDIVADINDIF